MQFPLKCDSILSCILINGVTHCPYVHECDSHSFFEGRVVGLGFELGLLAEQALYHLSYTPVQECDS
jgi:hypothetical protein